MKTSVIGFPYIGANRELKFATEKYFKKELSEEELLKVAENIKRENYAKQLSSGLDLIPCADFSFYDNFLDAAALFNIIPKRYRVLEGLQRYFAMARGHQEGDVDVKALAMKKWFGTNYHYMVSVCESAADIKLVGSKIIDEINFAKGCGVKDPKATLAGPFTLFKLTHFEKDEKELAIEKITTAYAELFNSVSKENITYLALEEGALSFDLSVDDVKTFKKIYEKLLQDKSGLKIILQSYFGDIRDVWTEANELDFDALGLDFIDGKKSLELLESFDSKKTLFAGVIKGHNVYKNHYQSTLGLINKIQKHAKNIVLNSSCSLLHVPISFASETHLGKHQEHLAGAVEKLQELADLKHILNSDETERLLENTALFRRQPRRENEAVQKAILELKQEDFTRLPAKEERRLIQKEELKLPLMPTTSIGSFPQTAQVRKNRLSWRKGEISESEYENFNKEEIKSCIELQNSLGMDVLVHGEFERNDMVEYFGQQLEGFLFTQNAWVVSYGTRYVKPPIIYGDVSRPRAMTVSWSKFAQTCSEKLVKGMLTGPVTILNWSFPREDISHEESTKQIALAIREEVLDLEKAGIKIIQIDEAALREKLPLRKSSWKSEYLNWAIPAFNLVHAKVEAKTQIHTHMCYSEFGDIIKDIDAMDADVISFEASRSDLAVLDDLKAAQFSTQTGPGVYDIHSPRVPSQGEFEETIKKIVAKIGKEKLWINPDCGLKTRAWEEVKAALANMIKAARVVRNA